MTGTVEAPWTLEQVAALEAWQACDWVHPFTCGGDHPREQKLLRPTQNGWVCGVCGYTQNWAHDFMFWGPPDHPLSVLDHFRED